MYNTLDMHIYAIGHRMKNISIKHCKMVNMIVDNHDTMEYSHYVDECNKLNILPSDREMFDNFKKERICT